jgi:acetyl-CoA carboxylase biotin carboxyl carrier protein
MSHELKQEAIMELNDLRELMGLLKDTDITELQIEKDGVRVRIKREKFFSHLEVHHPAIHEKIEAKEIKKEEKAEPEGRLFTVKSPIVGTFYRSSSPDSEPFVDIGAKVKKGQVLCVIEAMKLMNEIDSEIDGVIARVLVENGHPVEYGEPLFLIEPI